MEKEMATHSSVLARRIPGMGKPGGLPSVGSHRVGHDCSDLAARFYWSDTICKTRPCSNLFTCVTPLNPYTWFGSQVYYYYYLLLLLPFLPINPYTWFGSQVYYYLLLSIIIMPIFTKEKRIGKDGPASFNKYWLIATNLQRDTVFKKNLFLVEFTFQ